MCSDDVVARRLGDFYSPQLVTPSDIRCGGGGGRAAAAAMKGCRQRVTRELLENRTCQARVQRTSLKKRLLQVISRTH